MMALVDGSYAIARRERSMNAIEHIMDDRSKEFERLSNLEAFRGNTMSYPKFTTLLSQIDNMGSTFMDDPAFTVDAKRNLGKISDALANENFEWDMFLENSKFVSKGDDVFKTFCINKTGITADVTAGTGVINKWQLVRSIVALAFDNCREGYKGENGEAILHDMLPMEAKRLHDAAVAAGDKDRDDHEGGLKVNGKDGAKNPKRVREPIDDEEEEREKKRLQRIRDQYRLNGGAGSNDDVSDTMRYFEKGDEAFASSEAARGVLLRSKVEAQSTKVADLKLVDLFKNLTGANSFSSTDLHISVSK
jgi:hypothetical protein